MRALVLLLLASAALAQDAPIAPEAPILPDAPIATPKPPADDAFGLPGGFGSVFPKASYQVRWFPEADVRGQNTTFGFWTQDFSASSPLWADETKQALTAGVRNQLAEGSAVLPSGRLVPESLWNVKLGLAYHQRLDNDWTIGASVHVGSASDEPFHGLREMQIGVQASLKIPVRDHDAWLLSLSYNPTGDLNFPIPGVAYFWAPSEQVQMMIGLPLAVFYRPDDDWMFSVFYVPVTNVKAKASYRLLPGVKLYAAYDWTGEGYYLADRVDERDRLLEFDMRVTGGVEYSVNPRLRVDVFAGYSFDRSIFEGHSFSDNANKVDLANVPFFGAQATVKW